MIAPTHDQVSDDEHRQRYSEEIAKAKQAGADQFQAWFDKSRDVHQSIVRGYWDFSIHILTPEVCRHICNPEDKAALEIGYGGGRLLNAACSYFKQVIGIDIHGEQETVEEFLRSQGKQNFQLLRTTGRTIDVDSSSIDFVYSFIVLQHLPSYAVLESYVKETYRCLRAGGVAQLYYGKYSRLGLLGPLRHLIQGYKEIPTAKVNFISLVVHTFKMKGLCTGCGFEIVDSGTSFKRVPDGYPQAKGGQNYITLVKQSE